MFDAEKWTAVPFHFWSVVLFLFGTMVGSFLNVCIHRMPRGESIISPPSHCPHCQYRIPGYLNVPLFTWLFLRGKCANCRAPISVRYFLVELLTGMLFLACWLCFGRQSALLALSYCVVLAAFVVATFIDFEHFIIPDEITIGGAVAGIFFSFLVPQLHATDSSAEAMKQSLFGLVAGTVTVYAILRMGKLFFGRQKIELAADTKIIFTESAVQFPNEETPYEEIFYRDSDSITFHAVRIEQPVRCYANVAVRLSPTKLAIGEDTFNPEVVTRMEATTSEIILPREAMGLGDVKFMAAIGAFLGWEAVFFSLMFSSIIGAVVGIALIALKKQEWSSRLPYGPYIALAATLWIFRGPQIVHWLFARGSL